VLAFQQRRCATTSNPVLQWRVDPGDPRDPRCNAVTATGYKPVGLSDPEGQLDYGVVCIRPNSRHVAPGDW